MLRFGRFLKKVWIFKVLKSKIGGNKGMAENEHGKTGFCDFEFYIANL
jgi:hypothetical protein